MELHHHSQAGNCVRHQGEALLFCLGLEVGDDHCCSLAHPCRTAVNLQRLNILTIGNKWFPGPEALSALLPGHGILKYPKNYSQLHHEM